MTGQCNICGRSREIVKHHVLTRGAGGHEVQAALLWICVYCHSNVHNGSITPDAQLAIAYGRDNPEVAEAARQKVYDARRGIT